MTEYYRNPQTIGVNSIEGVNAKDSILNPFGDIPPLGNRNVDNKEVSIHNFNGFSA
jgi:hypothetical protein